MSTHWKAHIFWKYITFSTIFANMSGFQALIDQATPAELQELAALACLGDIAFEREQMRIFAQIASRPAKPTTQAQLFLTTHELLVRAGITTRATGQDNISVTFPRTAQGVAGMSVLCVTRYGPAHYETALITPTGGLKYLPHIGNDSILPRFDALDELVQEILRVYHKLYQPEYNRKKRQRAKVRRQKWLAAHPM